VAVAVPRTAAARQSTTRRVKRSCR
jgi:hypothetical protein